MRDSERDTEKATVALGAVTTDADRQVTISSARGALEDLPVGTELGRYVILQLRGAGGMGVVYAAYDPKLDRRVALKLLRSDETDPEAGGRLLREAQALAKLAHPNVVAVHDAGMLGTAVFIEMEYVEGVTLDEWVAGRSWSEILSAYRQAGRALAAAHAVGMVHRDFKPANAIVDETGRVRVLDFGLARPSSAGASGSLRPRPLVEDEEIVRATPSAPPAPSATVRGTVMGTPLYMPPEQWRGRPVDARADQYSFAASLFEALYGTAPFPTASSKTMQDDAARGPIAKRPASSRVPAYVHDAIVRALSFTPSDRFASMESLLDALATDPAAERRRRTRGALALVALVAAGGVAYRWERTREAKVCSAMDENLAGVWDEGKKRAVHDALTRSGKPFAEDAWTRTKVLLDTYAGQWVTMRTTTCLDARRRGAGEEAAVAARLVCLDWRLRELRALTNELARDDATSRHDGDVALQSVQAAADLVPVERCARASLHGEMKSPEDAGLRARVDAIRGHLAEAESSRLAGRTKTALPIAQAALADARSSGFAPVEALALITLGRIEVDDGDYKSAAQTLEQGAWVAEASRDDESLVAATTSLAMVVGYRQADRAGGARWEKHATAALARLGADNAHAGELEYVRSALARQRQDLAPALAHAERAVEILTRAYGSKHQQVARAEHNLGNTLVSLTRYDEAMTHYVRSRTLQEAIFGERHPLCATGLTSEAIVLKQRGDYTGAVALYRRALEIFEATRGPEHPDVAIVLGNLGLALHAGGKHQEALVYYERSLALRRKVHGPDHPLVASSLVAIGRIELEQHRDVEAREKFERALQIHEKAGGRDDPALAYVLLNLSLLALDEKKPKEALAFAERGAEIRHKRLGPLHPENQSALTILAKCYTALGEPARGIPGLERALQLQHEGNPRSVADASFQLARALRLTHGDVARALSLAKAAEAIYAKDGDGAKEDLDEVRAWLAAP